MRLRTLTNAASLAVLLGLGALPALAACGHPPAPAAPHGPSQPDGRITAMIDCYRSHGLPNFPDAEFDPSDRRWHLPDDRPDIPADVTRECAPPDSQEEPPSPIPTDRLNDLMAYARCVRAHGLPEWPDPRVDGVFVTSIDPKKVPNDSFTPCEQSLASSGGRLDIQRPR